jgi:hypothetical protein
LALRPNDTNARLNQARALARLRTLTIGDRTLEGVPRRRGLALGETPLGATDGGAPRDFDTEREPPAAPQRGEAVTGGERATAATPPADARAAQLDAERDYRAALKKLELVEDRPAAMLKALIDIDTPREPATTPELAPW